MDISIVIINYNTFDLTCACIQSVFDKTQGVDYEIILVDNNSTDRNPDEFLSKFPSLQLIKSSQNVGFAKGNNLGIARSRGRYILLLNSDTVLENNAVLICLEFLRKDPAIGVVSSLLKYADGEIQHNCQRFPSMKYGLFELLRLQKILPAKWSGKILFGSFFSYDEVAYPDWVWGTFFMFERKRLAEFPDMKLADDFFMYVEDMQWCMDFRNRGLRIAFEPKAKVIHYTGKSGGAKNEMMLQNTALFLSKHFTKWELSVIKCINRILVGK